MKRILIALLISLFFVSCVKVDRGPVTVEYGYFTDSYHSTDDCLVLVNCSIESFLEGESMVSVWIQNKVWSVKDNEFTFEIEFTSFMTTNDFQRELRKVDRRSRLGNTTQFVTDYRGLKITWDMFDSIYLKYADSR